MEKPYVVLVPGVMGEFEEWIAKRGGVAVWENRNLSNPNAGPMFTPANDKAGKPTGAPHWAFGLLEVCQSIEDFRFVKELKEVRRFRVAIRRCEGLMLKLTDHSTDKLHKALDKIKEETGQEACYRFDYGTQEAVIEVPVWA
jgi:hypothetical protein